MKLRLLILLTTALCGLCTAAAQPAPEKTTPREGIFTFGPGTTISADRELAPLAEYAAEYLGCGVRNGMAGEGSVVLTLDAPDGEPSEAYTLDIAPDHIQIGSSTCGGVFNGLQQLFRLLPPEVYARRGIAPGTGIACVRIEDKPRFGYRGMMLDVARTWIGMDEVKRYIDLFSYHNINKLHLHLSDDEGWRIEIRSHPELTEIGGFRGGDSPVRPVYGKWSEKYGGYFKQSEMRELIRYAALRNIEIIPEIDLPGHQLAALATYPELGCTGGPYEVWTQWGVSDDVICAGNEKSMQFLEDVLAEVIDLFPSEYIHIGGDECPKVRWQKCPKCQARIKAEGIKGDSKHSAEEYLQSYVISRMEKFVESKGRHIIGWDEILEGGLAPNATVMSWRGVGGGIEAAKQQHNVIMTPNSYLYFDYYQSTDTEHDPLAIGGYLPLERVYSFEPTDGIPEEYQKYVIGAQANLWTEYIPTFSQVEYMIMPRMDALADVQWSNAPKDYKAFLSRLVRMTKLYDRLGYNYAKHIFDIRASFATDGDKGEVVVTLETEGDADIYYTLDGSEPNAASPKYEAPLRIKENVEIKAVAIRPTGNSRIFSEKIDFNKATAKPVTLRVAPSKGYDFNGGPELTDGLSGNDNYKTGRWLGFQGKDVDAVIDLKEPTEFSRVAFNTNVVKGDWIMGAAGITVKVSDDGQTFKEVAAKTIPSLGKDDKDGLYPQEITFTPVKARYVEVIIKSDKLPAWHGGAGNPAFLFVDEINIQ